MIIATDGKIVVDMPWMLAFPPIGHENPDAITACRWAAMSSSGTTIFEATIQPWGDGLGLKITRSMRDLAHLSRGERVLVQVDENGLTVRRLTPDRRLGLPFSEADLVDGMTPHHGHADEIPAPLPSETGD
jgi:antitoxin MazE